MQGRTRSSPLAGPRSTTAGSVWFQPAYADQRRTVGGSQCSDSRIAGQRSGSGRSLEAGLQALFEAAVAGSGCFIMPVSMWLSCSRPASHGPVSRRLSSCWTPCAWNWMRKRRKSGAAGRFAAERSRASYHLPRYTAHNALIDACATAELMLAIAGQDGADPDR